MATLQSKGGEIELSTETVMALQARWITRDVENELLKMHLWLLQHPTRRPVRIWRFIDVWLERSPAVKRPTTVVNAWWATDERTINQGAAVGINPRPGETMAAFRDRLGEAMRKSA